jgi:PAS domain S-box-containing protein
MNRSRLLQTSRWLLFGLLMVAASSLREGEVSAIDQAIIWLPTGVAVAGLWLLGLRAWWVIALATLLQRRLLGYDLSVGIPAAAGSSAEAVIGVLVMRRLGFQRSLARLRDVGALFAAAVVAPLASILCSYVARSFFWSNPHMPFYSGWDGWWRMNALGVLTVVPFALTWLDLPRDQRTPRLLGGAAAAAAGLAVLALSALQLLPHDTTGILGLNLLLALTLLYAASRFDIRGATLASTVLALVVAHASAQGLGPFLDVPREQRHVALQLFELLMVALPPAFAALTAERRAALARTRHSEDLLASINRNVKEGLFRVSADLHVIYANLALARLMGFDSPEQVLGRSIGDSFADPEQRRALRDRLRAEGQWVNEEMRFTRPDGSTFWGLVSGTVVRDVTGTITHYDGAIADITARKALEEQFRQAQKMEAVGKLAGGVAHDFNNLLTVIVGYAHSIRDEASGQSSLRGHAQAVLDAASRATGLTRQLLAYSRQQVLSPRVVDLSAVVDRMGDMLRRLIREDIRLAVEHHTGPCWVRVDPGQIEQVLLNLVVNARDAMPGGGTLTISTALGDIDADSAAACSDLTAGPCVILRVSDTGVGMTPEVLARAFDPFFTTKEPGQGTGLGLATVYGIVKQSGGSVWLESEPGAGTHAWVGLPRASEPAVPAPPAAALARGPREGTVLVVEDEPGVRSLVCRTLERHGYRVIGAADGARGLEAARTVDGHLDLVVTDVVMPVMGGREMAPLLRAVHPTARFLFISGYPEDARAPEEVAGVSGDFLAKPFTPDQLLERVERLLANGKAAG